jgi:hypothetical protein
MTPIPLYGTTEVSLLVNNPFDDADGRLVVLVNDAGWNDYRDTVRPQQALPVGWTCR